MMTGWEVGMTNEIPEILRLYLGGGIDFDTLENRIISLAWDPDEREDQLLLDTILAEIFYIWDNVSDEPLFRERIAQLIAPEPNRAPPPPARQTPSEPLSAHLPFTCGYNTLFY